MQTQVKRFVLRKSHLIKKITFQLSINYKYVENANTLNKLN